MWHYEGMGYWCMGPDDKKDFLFRIFFSHILTSTLKMPSTVIPNLSYPIKKSFLWFKILGMSYVVRVA